jgi:hypothetical protein
MGRGNDPRVRFIGAYWVGLVKYVLPLTISLMCVRAWKDSACTREMSCFFWCYDKFIIII